MTSYDMSIRKYTKLVLAKENATLVPNTGRMAKVAKLSDFQFVPQPGFLYVTTRAISSRVNANYDGWPPEEIQKSWRTFIGRGVFVDHTNWDIDRSRGVILDASIHENKLASGHEDVWVELLIEVDAEAYPKLAKAILSGEIDAVSMGADVEYTICSVCDNRATDVLSYCAHIPQMKGKVVDTLDAKTGSSIKKLCYEDCFGVSFFEISFVFDPADESALINDTLFVPRAAGVVARTVQHLRRRGEGESDYRTRTGTFSKVASIKEADKPVLRVPQPVNTLRDEMNCPNCNAEWDGMLCTACGFEQPPEGLGDPNTDPLGMAIPMGGPEEGSSEDVEEEDESSDEEEDESETKNNKKKGGKRVSRYDELLKKQATLPVDPPYRQDTSPAQSVPPYGEAVPGGTPVDGLEPALEPGLSAPAMVQDLDGQDVVAPVGQSAVTVVNEVPGPTEVPPPGSQAGEALNSQVSDADAARAASVSKRKAKALLARAARLHEKAAQFEKEAEEVYVTDVRNLDEPPPVNVGPDATLNVMAPTQSPEQLLLADTPDVINDGSETGLPPVRERLPQEINPFNDAALVPYGQSADIPWGASEGVQASVKEAACDCKEGEECVCKGGECHCEGVKKAASVDEEVAKEAERELQKAQEITAAKTRIFKIANFVDERISLGLTAADEKINEINRFDALDDSTLDGFMQATEEIKERKVTANKKVAAKRVKVAAHQVDENVDRVPNRMPSLGGPETLKVSSEEFEPADDYLTFLK